MQNVLLIVELILALALIGIVLLQKSEGAGGLGMSGGNITGRAPATGLGRVTWWLGLAFFVVALALTIVEAENSGNSSVLDRIGNEGSAPAETLPVPSDADLLSEPNTSAPSTPPAAGAPATPPAADSAPATPPANP